MKIKIGENFLNWRSYSITIGQIIDQAPPGLLAHKYSISQSRSQDKRKGQDDVVSCSSRYWDVSKLEVRPEASFAAEMTTYDSQYDYSFFSPGGIDHQLMALYCARAITDGFTPAKYTNARDWEEKLQAFISAIIYRSQLGLGVTIAGLTLSRRFQAASQSNIANTIDDARRVFLIGYMIAAKIMFDNDISLVWWKRVIEREYDCSDLVKLEKKFYKTVAWDVQIDGDEFLQGLNEAFTWYEDFIKEHTLPSSPLPTYHPHQKRRSRLPTGLSLELADGAQMPVTGLSDTIGLPMPCTAAVQKRPQGLTGMVLRFGRRVTQF